MTDFNPSPETIEEIKSNIEKRVNSTDKFKNSWENNVIWRDQEHLNFYRPQTDFMKWWLTKNFTILKEDCQALYHRGGGWIVFGYHYENDLEKSFSGLDSSKINKYVGELRRLISVIEPRIIGYCVDKISIEYNAKDNQLVTDQIASGQSGGKQSNENKSQRHFIVIRIPSQSYDFSALEKEIDRPNFEDGPTILVSLCTKEPRFDWNNDLSKIIANSRIKNLHLRESYSHGGGTAYPVKRPNGKIIQEIQVYPAKGIIDYFFVNPFYYENALNRIDFEQFCLDILMGIYYCAVFAQYAGLSTDKLTVIVARAQVFRWVMPGDSAMFNADRHKKLRKPIVSLQPIELSSKTIDLLLKSKLLEEFKSLLETPPFKSLVNEFRNHLE